MRSRAEKRAIATSSTARKMWITNGPDADTLVVYAKTDPEAGAKGITAFIVEKGFEGLSRRAEARQARHARLDTGELVFEDCEVPEENVARRVERRREAC